MYCQHNTWLEWHTFPVVGRHIRRLTHLCIICRHFLYPLLFCWSVSSSVWLECNNSFCMMIRAHWTSMVPGTKSLWSDYHTLFCHQAVLFTHWKDLSSNPQFVFVNSEKFSRSMVPSADGQEAGQGNKPYKQDYPNMNPSYVVISWFILR